jgi:hypothetical protein
MPTDDTVIRIAAVVAAAALLAAPHWERIVGWLAQATEAARAHAATIGRVAAACLVIAAAWGMIPMPKFTAPVAPSVTVPTPSPEAQRLVEPVRAALAGLPADKRALWAATWAKAALVVEAEGATSVTVLTDTASLRVLTVTALDIAWRRIGNVAPGSVEGLREAVEAAMRSALGLDSVPVTPDVRARYAEVARAIAWAATGG